MDHKTIQSIVDNLAHRAREKLFADFKLHSPEEWFDKCYPPFRPPSSITIYTYKGDYVGAMVRGFAEQMTVTDWQGELGIQRNGHDRHKFYVQADYNPTYRADTYFMAFGVWKLDKP